MLDSKLLAALLISLGDTATPIIQMGSSTDRYDITGLQFEHYPNDRDYMVLVAGSNNLQDRTEPDESIMLKEDSPKEVCNKTLSELEGSYRKYLLDLLPYQLLHLLSEADIKQGANCSDSIDLYRDIWDEFPDLILTEDEIQGAFQGAEKLLK